MHNKFLTIIIYENVQHTQTQIRKEITQEELKEVIKIYLLQSMQKIRLLIKISLYVYW